MATSSTRAKLKAAARAERPARELPAVASAPSDRVHAARQLRDATGQFLGQCTQALDLANGNVAKAETMLRAGTVQQRAADRRTRDIVRAELKRQGVKLKHPKDEDDETQ